jgi:thiol-disulfide isomerase/thioredoxin
MGRLEEKLMQTWLVLTRSGAATVAFMALAAVAQGHPLAGLWDGEIKYDDVTVEFPMELSRSGNGIKGSFFNGDERVTSTSGIQTGNSLVLDFADYATRLSVIEEGGVLNGTYGNKLQGVHEIKLRRHRTAPSSGLGSPDISGLWTLPFESPKGEHAWRFIVRQHRTQVSAAILRVDGDTGVLSGHYQDGQFVLNHFDGGRPLRVTIVPRQDGELDVMLRGPHAPSRTLTAVRPAAARAKGLPSPSVFAGHTTMKNPSEPLRFSFPDLSGKLVSNTDPQFKNKVLVVNITGSWCPNCHDEAPFLAEMYHRYHSLGLEVVALDFEDEDQLKNPTRLPAFIKHYGIDYTYLLAGQTSELAAKVPQAERLNAWPTTFFIARDGRVRTIHTGFAAAASGAFHTQLRQEFAGTVERLLAE